jgi:hypothetical protein
MDLTKNRSITILCWKGHAPAAFIYDKGEKIVVHTH